MTPDVQERLPPGWSWVSLADLAAPGPRAITDGPFGSNLKTTHYVCHGPRVLRLQNVGDGVFVDEKAHISEAHFRTLSAHEALAGDLLIASLGKELPRACLVPPTVGPAIVKADVIRMRVRADTSPAYLMHALNSPLVRGLTSSRIHGVGRPRLNLGEIREIRIPVAPLDEQRRIVEAIEEQFSRIDAGERALGAVTARCHLLKAAMLSAAISGHMSESDPGVVPIDLAALDHIRLKRTTTQKTTTVPDLDVRRPLPAGWIEAPIVDLVTRMDYGTSARTSEDASGTPVLRMGNVQAGKVVMTPLKYLPSDHPDLEGTLLERGDLLFNRTNSSELVGKSAVFERGGRVSFASYLIRLRFCRQVNPRWVAIVLNSPAGRSFMAAVQVQQVGQANVNGSKLAAMRIPLPPLAEQDRLVTRLDQVNSVVDAAISGAEAGRLRAAALRRSLLAKAFSGQLFSSTGSGEEQYSEPPVPVGVPA